MQHKPITAAKPLENFTKDQAAYLSERAAVERELNKELACLVQEKGYLYAQLVANEIQKEFECKPTDPGWHTYTTIQYALNQLFGRIKKRAQSVTETATPGRSILAEIKEQDDSNGRRNKSTSRTASGRRRSKSR